MIGGERVKNMVVQNLFGTLYPFSNNRTRVTNNKLSNLTVEVAEGALFTTVF